LGKSGNFVYKNRRKLGLLVPSRKEWQRKFAVERGVATPKAWGVKNPSTPEEYQSWAWFVESKQWIKEANKLSWKNHPIVFSEYGRKAAQKLYERKKHEPQFVIKRAMRNAVWRALRSIGKTKTKRTRDYFGCSEEELAKHIEKQFRNGMSWQNRSQWHVDHIIPLSAFNLCDERQMLMANHFTNLQPLWAKENLMKRDKILSSHQLALL